MKDFFNRTREIQYFNDWFEGKPNAMLFVYGPKSCGKSTLILKVLEGLNKKKYAANYIDLRGVLLYDFRSFLDTFFQKSKSDKLRGIIEGITINAGFFSIGVDDENMLKKNPFKVMEDQLERAVKKGKQPIIVIDEIQMLKGIYLNGERFLLDELFNLFARLTKVRHLAHVVLLTSDSFFINEIYRSSKLNKVAEYYRLDHFSKNEVLQWLSEAKIEPKDIEYIWKYLGGSLWEINRVLDKLKAGQAIRESVKYFLNEEHNRVDYFIKSLKLSPEEAKIMENIHKAIATRGFASQADYAAVITDAIIKMVKEEIWFYQADKQRITANSESIRWAIRKILANSKRI